VADLIRRRARSKLEFGIQPDRSGLGVVEQFCIVAGLIPVAAADHAVLVGQVLDEEVEIPVANFEPRGEAELDITWIALA